MIRLYSLVMCHTSVGYRVYLKTSGLKACPWNVFERILYFENSCCSVIWLWHILLSFPLFPFLHILYSSLVLFSLLPSWHFELHSKYLRHIHSDTCHTPSFLFLQQQLSMDCETAWLTRRCQELSWLFWTSLVEDKKTTRSYIECQFRLYFLSILYQTFTHRAMFLLAHFLIEMVMWNCVSKTRVSVMYTLAQVFGGEWNTFLFQ